MKRHSKKSRFGTRLFVVAFVLTMLISLTSLTAFSYANGNWQDKIMKASFSSESNFFATTPSQKKNTSPGYMKNVGSNVGTVTTYLVGRGSYSQTSTIYNGLTPYPCKIAKGSSAYIASYVYERGHRIASIYGTFPKRQSGTIDIRWSHDSRAYG